MKKRFAILVIGLFLSINISNAATCTDAWNATNDQLYQNYLTGISNCGSTECENAVITEYNLSNIVNDGLWLTCCYISPLNCY